MTSSTQPPQSERDVRIAKAQALHDMGINPYAQKFDKTSLIGDHLSQYEKNVSDGNVSPFRDINDIIAGPRPHVSTAGRLTLYRTHGKLSFGKLMDESGEIQVMWHRDSCNLTSPHPSPLGEGEGPHPTLYPQGAPRSSEAREQTKERQSNDIKYLIFDFDGVLADSFEVGCQIMVDGGKAPTIEQSKAGCLHYANTKPDHTKNHTLTDEQMHEAKQGRKMMGQEMIKRGLPLFTDFINAIKAINPKKCAIVSSNDETMIATIMKESGIEFTHILGFGDHHSKEEKIQTICHDRDVAVSNVYYFTDTKADVYELQDFLAPDKLIGCAWGYSGYDALAEVLDKQYILRKAEDIYQSLDHTSSSIALPEGLTPYKLLEKYIDVGDFLGVRGELFYTHKGELTLFVSEFQLLSKAIRPLGDKFHGIGEDKENAYRQRYLDMIFNRETLERMKLRSNFIKTLRQFYREHDFLEIDCPVLTPSASGAAAKPFVTYHNDFDREYFLRICNETELKKATVGGLEKVFTIATVFRNEGSDPSHLQEFTMLEHQSVYRSLHDDMKLTEQMFDYLFDRLDISRTLIVKDKQGNPREVNFTTPWPKIDYVEGVNKASGLDITTYTIDDADRLRADIRAKGIEFEGMDVMGTMTLIDYLYKKVLRPTITGPAFVYNYPSIIAPLARTTDQDPTKCEKRQVVVNGREIINAYGELVDPIKQKQNFEEQAKAEAGGDAEATSADDDFVKAMEYGMPIQAGFGMGIDRVIAIMTGQENLRDVVMFPLVKPIITDTDDDKQEEKK